jgi:ribosomal protein L17
MKRLRKAIKSSYSTKRYLKYFMFKHRAARYGALALLLTFALGNGKCDQTKMPNLDAKKAAVADTQHALDIFKDGLSVIQANKLLPDAEIKEIATRAKDINTANSALIDAAWSGDVTTQLDALKSALSAFINSGAVIKNKGSQQAINTLVDALAKDLEVLRR